MPEHQPPLKYRPVITFKDSHPGEGGADSEWQAPDVRDGRIYLCDEAAKLAVQVALVTGRPLLVRGEPGTGKSSLAAYVARQMNARYYEHVVTARTQASDLLWTFDAVRRLGDAQARSYMGRRPLGDNQRRAATQPTPARAKPELDDYDYVMPGVLWWAFDRTSARRRGAPDGHPYAISFAVEPYADVNAQRSRDSAVVLIDEIDKADPDVPNNLLVPLGSLEFRVAETGTLVRYRQAGRETAASAARRSANDRLLIVITTNDERELPQAFLRRCVVHQLEHPDIERLIQIATLHFDRPPGSFTQQDKQLCHRIAAKVDEIRQQVGSGTRKPSTAEFLDAVRACRRLVMDTAANRDYAGSWELLERLVLRKQYGPDEGV
jgi:MoxR-like ATPase